MAPNTVRPTEWVLPTRVGFPEWVYKTFHASKYANQRTSQFIQQRLVRDFMQRQSPYKGILLYHGLGSGKTCSAIAATEAYAQSGRRVVVMLPASLAQNYLNELMSCGNLSRWTAITLDTSKPEDATILAGLKKAFHYSADFIKRHATLDKTAPERIQLWMPWTPLKQTPGPAAQGGRRSLLFDASRCDHHNVRVRALTEDQRTQVDKTLKDILPNLYYFIKYNGLTQKAMEKYTPRFFENSVVVIDEAHNFISQATHPGTLNYRVYQNLRAARNCRLVLLSGTPAINNPFEIGTTLNLLRGDLRVFDITLPAQGAPSFPTTAEIRERLQSIKNNGVPLDRYIDDVMTQPGERKIRFILLPHGYIKVSQAEERPSAQAAERPSAQAEVIPKPWGMSVDAFEARLAELFSPVQKARALHYNAYPSTAEEFNDLFLDLEDPEKPKMQEHDLFMRRALGLVSYLTNVDDGTYPKVLPERVVECPMSAHQFETYEKNRKKELEMEQSQARRRASGRVDPFGKVSSVYRAFSRMTCNFAFPKELNRPFPRDMKAARAQMDFAEEDVAANREEQVEEVAPQKATAAYERALEDALIRLRTRGEAYLSEESLADTYSPKMAKAIADIHDSPGKVLFYSQFRTVEGIGIMRLALIQAGWAEIQVSKSNNGHWRVHGVDGMTAEELFDAKYAGKRFVVFNSDRDKTEVLMRIFNGQVQLMPPSVKRQLAALDAPYERIEDNLYGDKCALMMVSQSGAEGISLKHVRRVLILEPFWNKVRIDQVIGRAARRFSHTDLSPEDRDVEVRIYTAVFTPDQIAKSFTIQTHEQGISSDTHIANIAIRKNNVISEFLNSLKAAAIDCAVLAETNRLSEEAPGEVVSKSTRCYQFPSQQPRTDSSFLPDIKEDRSRAAAISKRLIPRDVRGRVVQSKETKKKMVLIEGRLYDYEAYKHAGMLVEA